MRYCNQRSPAGENGNILLIRFKSIGDILFTLPAVHVIRGNFPKAKITYLTSKENVPLIAGFREVDEVIGIDRSIYHRGNPLAIFRETFSLLRRLRQERFSLVVDFQGYGETGLITRLSSAKNRWGSVYQPGRGWAYTRAVRREKLAHPADWNLSLLRQCGLSGGPVRNEFVVPDAALDDSRRFFISHGLDLARATLFIQPFTSTPGKNWPLDNFLALAANWRNRGLQIVFGGGPADYAALAPARGAGFEVAAGVPLIVTAGLMKHCDVIVGGDTGLLHLAVAMNKRVVMLTRSAGHNKCHPFQHPDWVIYPAAGNDISRITTGAVIEACARALADQLETSGARR
jgi:ADP-heptose:LPS heptosyltransferase